jgi:hypothetical protein
MAGRRALERNMGAEARPPAFAGRALWQAMPMALSHNASLGFNAIFRLALAAMQHVIPANVLAIGKCVFGKASPKAAMHKNPWVAFHALSKASLAYTVSLASELTAIQPARALIGTIRKLLMALAASNNNRALAGLGVLKPLRDKAHAKSSFINSLGVILDASALAAAVLMKRKAAHAMALFVSVCSVPLVGPRRTLLRLLAGLSKASPQSTRSLCRPLPAAARPFGRVIKSPRLMLGAALSQASSLANKMSYLRALSAVSIVESGIGHAMRYARMLSAGMASQAFSERAIFKALWSRARASASLIRHWAMRLAATALCKPALMHSHGKRILAGLHRRVLAPLKRQTWRP